MSKAKKELHDEQEGKGFFALAGEAFSVLGDEIVEGKDKIVGVASEKITVFKNVVSNLTHKKKVAVKKAPAPKKAATKKSVVKKIATKATAGQNAVAKKATAGKNAVKKAVKKSPAKKAARKATGGKTVVKKVAKKLPAKKATARKR